MATKSKPNQLLLDAFKDASPKSPALTNADRTYLRGLTRRGFTHEEILNIAQKTGIKVTAEDLKTNGGRPAGSTNKPKTTV